MIEALREEAIVDKVGGRFKLSTLIQKRLVAINSGARPLVNLKTDNKIEIVIQEILQDKIYLDTELNVQTTTGQQAPARTNWISAAYKYFKRPLSGCHTVVGERILMSPLRAPRSGRGEG